MTNKPRPAISWKGPADLADKKKPREKVTAGVPLVQVIKRKLAAVPELVMLTDTRSLVAEKFRRLRTTLEQQGDDSPQAMVITSATPNEGKSFVSMNLSIAFAAEGRGEVLLIDTDLRRPSIQNWLTPDPQLGLSDILEGRTELDHALLTLENSPLKVLPAGLLPREPTELLSSDAMRELMTVLRARFQRIIVDTPPIVPFSDAEIVGSLCDGFVLVARSCQTEKAAYEQAQTMMSSSRVLGVVLNDKPPAWADWNHRSSKYYYAYYEEERQK